MPYVGNIEEVKWVYDEEEAREKGSPICIDTPNLEVRVIVLQPGVYPPYHAHHEEMDEGYLIYNGRGMIHNDGDTFEVGKGNVLLNPRGAMHHMKNTGQDELIEFNFRGGRMPSGFLMPPGDPPPNPRSAIGAKPTRPARPLHQGRRRFADKPVRPRIREAKGLPEGHLHGIPRVPGGLVSPGRETPRPPPSGNH